MSTSTESKTNVLKHIEDFKKKGIVGLENLTQTQLESIILECNKAFHGDKTPLLNDMQYDIIVDFVTTKFPKNKVLEKVGIPVEKNKIKLPYEMASMDKIKPDTDALDKWKQKYSGPYLLSCKLDGVSGLYSTEGPVPKLYTRGDGKIGQDVTHLIPYLKLPINSGITVRGEFIMSKSVFSKKYATKYANIRNLVAGIVNRITYDEKVEDLEFVCYEQIVPVMKPSDQMKNLEITGFKTVAYKLEKNINNELLSEYLVTMRKNYDYEIDGIIVADDKIYPRKSGNPSHAFAFKMVLSDQIAEAKVVNVIWTPSKDGYLKPRVQIQPINLGGVTIEYATGFNAAFIIENVIGIGALIQIIRSGDVIPHIKSVTIPASEPMMPSVPYIWNETGVDIMLEDPSSDTTVIEKNITYFFQKIGVDGVGKGNIVRIIETGYDTIPKIVHMKKSDFLKVEGFKDKLATKIYEGIHESLVKASLITLMSASNIFGRGISEKKIEPILDAFPDILTSSSQYSEKIDKIITVKGIAEKTAEAFVQNIPTFLEFIHEIGLESKLIQQQETSKKDITKAPAKKDESHPLYKKSIVMTGTRDETVKKLLEDSGAILSNSVSKNTFVVIAKTKDDQTVKAKEARKLEIPIMTPDEFIKTYG
jgi:NAD-dependent DNA ligase